MQKIKHHQRLVEMAKKKELQNTEINKTKPAISTNWEEKVSYHTNFTTSTSYGKVSAIPVGKVGWFNPATSAGFEPVASSDFFGPVNTTLIAPLLMEYSVFFSFYLRALWQ